MARKKRIEGETESKELILDAAITEFAVSGFHGARIDSIAGRSGINKAMIYYHFKGKDELYSAIIERLFGSIYDLVTRQASLDQPPDAKITAMIGMIGEFIGNLDDNMRRLLLWEIASGGDTFKRIAGFKFLKKIVPLIKGIYKDGVNQGLFRKDINPFYTQMTIVGSFIFSNSIHMVLKKSALFNFMFGKNFKKDFTVNLLQIVKGGILKS